MQDLCCLTDSKAQEALCGRGARPYLRAMPKCSLNLDGVANEWAVKASLIERLNNTGLLIHAPSEGAAVKPCNSHVSFNFEVLQPLVARMAEHPTWELFNLPTITAQ